MRKREDAETNVDKGLVAMFLKMSVEERLLANDNAVRTIQELRDAFRKSKRRRKQTKRTS